MSDAVLLSIRPEWCNKIGSGEKTIEIRKTRPKIETPFKCYIYCTANDLHRALVIGGGEAKQIVCFNYKTAIAVGGTIGNGKVIGEFICDYISVYKKGISFNENRICISLRVLSGLTIEEILGYSNGKDIYGWHISKLVIYDKPRELSDFVCRKPLTRPPQSWCYVEDKE